MCTAGGWLRSNTMTRKEINWCYGGDDRLSRLAELKKHEARQQAALVQAGHPELERKADAMGKAESADALLDAGDMDGQRVWLRVIEAIKVLSATSPPPGSTRH